MRVIIKPLIIFLLIGSSYSNFKVFTFLGGAHLVKTYGKTISEAKENDISIKSSFSFFKSSVSSESSLINQMYVAQNKISKIIESADS